MAELLLELLSEEIPARMQARAAEDLRRLFCDGLRAEEIVFTKAETFVTPRRLALVIDGLPKVKPGKVEERRGPRVDAPQQAIDGFLRANGIALDQCEKRDTGKGVFWFATKIEEGGPIIDVLHPLIYRVIWNFPWPKSMRWSKLGLRWIRPLRGILLVFNGKLLSIDIPLLHPSQEEGGGAFSRSFPTTNKTFGHRFLAPKPFAVRNFTDYKKKLLKARVMLDAAERRGRIVEDAARLAAAKGFVVVPDEGLLNEVAGLVEWPVVLLGHIDESFMTLPPEVLTTTMRQHQKYFSLKDKSGKLAPLFAVVSNMETKDKGTAIVAGNERVLRARLSDARFFWDQDRKRTLGSRVDALKARVFHAKLGSDYERVQRLRELASKLSRYIPNADPVAAERAAELAKADLTTGMVGEFPELQGIMGRYYALHDGETKAVADAVAEHYAPLGPDAACPTAPVSVAVALADKLDTLVGFFAIDEKPTGSKDPFALRRAALGVIRLIVENNLRVPLREAIYRALGEYIKSFQRLGRDGAVPLLEFYKDKELLVSDLLAFFADRLKVGLKEPQSHSWSGSRSGPQSHSWSGSRSGPQSHSWSGPKGVRYDLIDAVFATKKADGSAEDDLVRLLARVDALKNFLAEADGANLLVAYRRAANILKIEEKKDGKSYDAPPDAALLSMAEEKALDAALKDAQPRIAAALATEKFGEAMSALARLRGPVDAFFDKVTVNCDDPGLRANRLKLLSRIRAALGGVADFSKIEG